MTSFDHLWLLLTTHGVIESRRGEAAELWDKFNLNQQRSIYRKIRDKIRAGKYVDFNPVKAIRDNRPKLQIISADEYYRRNGTQDNLNGWVRIFLPDQQKTVYVKHA